MCCSFDPVNVETFTVFLGNRLRGRARISAAQSQWETAIHSAAATPKMAGHAARLAAMSSAAFEDEGPP
jgi:hypothetical protein